MEEVEEFVQAASALAVNVGTLEPNWVAAMKLAAKRCVEVGKPWVLDPVGAGAQPCYTLCAHHWTLWGASQQRARAECATGSSLTLMPRAATAMHMALPHCKACTGLSIACIM